MDLNGGESTVDEIVGGAIMVGFDLWMVVLFLEVEKGDGLDTEV